MSSSSVFGIEFGEHLRVFWYFALENAARSCFRKPKNALISSGETIDFTTWNDKSELTSGCNAVISARGERDSLHDEDDQEH